MYKKQMMKMNAKKKLQKKRAPDMPRSFIAPRSMISFGYLWYGMHWKEKIVKLTVSVITGKGGFRGGHTGRAPTLFFFQIRFFITILYK